MYDDPGAVTDEDTAPGSFFAERLAEAHDPWVIGKIEIPAPSDEAVAALDDVGTSPIDVLELICPDETFDLVLDVIDVDRIPPGHAAREALAHFHIDRPPTIGWHELVERINLYGPGIEYDLDSGGFRWGLHDYFLGRVPGGWDHFVRIIGRLPMGSHYRSAIADDDRLAEQIAARYGPPSAQPKKIARPPLTEFTREVAYLHRIDYRLSYLAWAVFAAQAGKKRSSPPKPEKGPETANERYEAADFMREHEEVVSQVLKRKGAKRPEPAAEAVRGAVLLNPPAIGDKPDSDDEDGPQG